MNCNSMLILGTDSPEIPPRLSGEMETSPPNKRLKTLNPNSIREESSSHYESVEWLENQLQSKQLISKDNDSDSFTCGICLYDNGNAIRGQIDSCDHVSCFVCIMEWAKVESRCPMCKRRFTTIRRPPKEGLFLSERIVNVNQRDQVYVLSGNTSIGKFDPYSQTQCSVCRSSKDESFLLLCDLCDSAAHTFCVGLGFTIPEGDWFCHDCAVSKTEHENIQNDEDVNQESCLNSNELKAAESDVPISSESILDNSNVISVDQSNVSIFDIVCDSDESVLACLQARSTSSPHESQPNLSEEMDLPGESTQTRHRRPPQSHSDKINQNGARTLSRCRNVWNYVQALRDNQNAISMRDNRYAVQNRSLRPSSTSTTSSRLNVGNRNTVEVSHVCLGQSKSSSTAKGKKVIKNESSHGASAHSRCSYDTDKAWKMLDKAKSVKQKSRSVGRVLNYPPPDGGGASKTATNGSSSLHSSNIQLASRELRNNSMTEKQYKFCSPGKETDKHISTKQRMQKHSLSMPKATAGSYDDRANSSPGFPASASLSTTSWKNQISREKDTCHGNGETRAPKNLDSASQNVNNMEDGSGSSVSSVMPVPEASKSLKVKADLSASSSQKADVSKEDVKTELEAGCSRSKTVKFRSSVMSVLDASESLNTKADLSASSSQQADVCKKDVKVELETGCSRSNTGKFEDAKSEIQLLVKLNLKLLDGVKQLGTKGFKEVARVVTHTILAACGFEQSRYVFHTVPSTVCSHSDGIQQLQKSTLMPNSCQECFYVFVMDVANLVLSDKLSKARAT